MGLRRATQLDRFLDRALAGAGPEGSGDLAPLVRAARASLARSIDAGVAQEHLAALRADRARNVVVVPPARRTGLRVAAVALVGAIVLTAGAGSAIAASANALPGDPLYGVKRAVERVSLAMHFDHAGRAALHLQFAQKRLDEVEALAAAGKDPGDAAQAFDDELNRAEEDALQAVAVGQDADALLAHVQEMIAKHLDVLNGVLGRVPDQAKDAIQRAIDNARKAEAKVQHGRQQPRDNNRGGNPDHGRPSTAPGKDGSSTRH